MEMVDAHSLQLNIDRQLTLLLWTIYVQIGCLFMGWGAVQD
jgi:hypothetical protein